MSSGARSIYSRHAATVDPVLPPDLRKLGRLPFTQQDHELLRSWLSEAGWPRGSMDLATLEGYLVALLVWPIDLPSGAWLPPIWGEQGWKVPAKLMAPTTFDRFVALVGGFLQALDRDISARPLSFIVTVHAPQPRRRGLPQAGCPWAAGFLSALKQHSQGLKYCSKTAKSAAAAIAACASIRPTSDTGAKLSRAAIALAAVRSSRGPLGVLEPVKHPGS